MAVTKYLARDTTIEINTAYGSGGDDFVAIGGLNTLTHSPATETADTTDFDSGGRPEHIVAQRGDSWALAGFALEDVTTGDRDEGQAAVEALGKVIGLSALGQFRVTSPGGNTATFLASAEVTLAGGGLNDAAAWSANLTVSGDVTYA